MHLNTTSSPPSYPDIYLRHIIKTLFRRLFRFKGNFVKFLMRRISSQHIKRKKWGRGRWRSCSERKCQLLSFWEEKSSVIWAEVWGEDNGGDNNGSKRLLLILILDATILHFHFPTFYQDTDSLSLSLFLSLSLYFLSPPSISFQMKSTKYVCLSCYTYKRDWYILHLFTAATQYTTYNVGPTPTPIRHITNIIFKVEG